MAARLYNCKNSVDLFFVPRHGRPRVRGTCNKKPLAAGESDQGPEGRAYTGGRTARLLLSWAPAREAAMTQIKRRPGSSVGPGEHYIAALPPTEF